MNKFLSVLLFALLMVGCETAKLGRIDLDDPETRNKIIAGAIDWGKLQERGEKGEKLLYAPNEQTPYTGWAKEMWDNGRIRGLDQWKDGKWDGLGTQWYSNGQKEWEETWKDGKLWTSVRWKPNGEKCPDTNVVNGNGVFVYYNEDGTESGRSTYKNGEELSERVVLAAGGARAESETERDLYDAESRYYEAEAVMKSKYRKDLAATFAKADRVEVYLLDFEMEDTPSDFLFWENRLEDGEFPITPYGNKSKILKRATLTVEQQRAFVPKLQEVVGVQGDGSGGAFCHFPIHGVRVFAGEEILFQSSFCWKCNNFAVSYPDASSWVGIRTAGVFAAFAEVMPIPQTELDRFDAKYGSKAERTKTKAEQDGADQPATDSDAKAVLQGHGFASPKPDPNRCDPTTRMKRLRAAGGHPEVDKAVTRGLQWLKKTQAADGSWGTRDKRPDGSSISNDKNAMTGMALLCFLGHCELQDSEEFGATVQKAIKFLTSTPAQPTSLSRPIDYSHPIRVYALCEAYTMTKIKELGPFAKKGAEAIIKGQNESGGWAYIYSKGPSAHVDLSVTGWNIQALKAASLTGLKIDGLDEAMDKAADYVKR